MSVQAGPLPLPLYRDDGRVRVTEQSPQHAGEYDRIETWYFGMSGQVMYVVALDCFETPWVFAGCELERA